MIYILIISTLMYFPDGGSIYKNIDYKFQEFNSQKACENAKRAMLGMASRYQVDGKPLHIENRVLVECVPKA